jgi:hypothetical protein
MRARWTDERLDDLSRRVDKGFERVDADRRELRAEMNAKLAFLHGAIARVCIGVLVAALGPILDLVLGVNVALLPLLWPWWLSPNRKPATAARRMRTRGGRR